MRLKKAAEQESLPSVMDLPVGGMTYAQCPALWTFFQGRTLASERMPIKVFDRSGTSHRYESGGLNGIERVDEFHRMELVKLGAREQTVEAAGALAEYFKRLFEESDEWLEFQNLSINGTTYPKGFTVKLQSGEPLWSGCSGIGLERWTAVFIAQKGPDPSKWPKAMRELYGETPRGIRFL